MSDSHTAMSAMDRILDQFSDCLNPEAARRIVEFQIDEETQARVEALGERAKEGLLSDEERLEYRNVVEVADLITILKLKARRLLAASKGP